MKKPVCLMSTFCLGIDTGPLESRKAIEIFKKREEIFQENGLELKLLLPIKGCWGDIKNMGSNLKKAMPESVVELSDQSYTKIEPYLSSLSWPRDLFQVFGNDCYIFKGGEKSTKKLLKNLGAKNLNFYESPLGEGGCNVRVDNFMLLSNFLSHEHFKEKIKRAKSQGFVGYFMPTFLDPEKAKNANESTLANRMSQNRHIDTEMNLIRTPDKKFIYMISPEYYQVFGKAVRDLAEELHAKLYIPEEERMAINSINLPNGRVIIPEQYRSTIQFLRENMGDKNIISIETLPREISHQGGIRCRTNIIE